MRPLLVSKGLRAHQGLNAIEIFHATKAGIPTISHWDSKDEPICTHTVLGHSDVGRRPWLWLSRLPQEPLAGVAAPDRKPGLASDSPALPHTVGGGKERGT